MRYFLAFIIFIMLPAFLHAQGNLQFNQVLNYQGELYTGNLSSPVYTVPTGKVWKIEYFTPFKFGPTEPIGTIGLYINGIAVSDEKSATIWLKAGASVQYNNNGYFTSISAVYQTAYYKALRSYQLSVIEYNIVP